MKGVPFGVDHLALDGPEIPEVLAIGDGTVDAPEEDEWIEPPVGFVDASHPDGAPRLDLRRPPVRYGDAVVYYGGCTHTSGKQRVFACCDNEAQHGRCQKYRFLDHHPSDEHAVAWLFAWHAASHAMASRVGPLGHYSYVPREDEIKLWLDRLG